MPGYTDRVKKMAQISVLEVHMHDATQVLFTDHGCMHHGIIVAQSIASRKRSMPGVAWLLFLK